MNFFINRPIFAAAIALMMVLAGIISMLMLPIAQYPPLVPPQIQVATKYTGASAGTQKVRKSGMLVKIAGPPGKKEAKNEVKPGETSGQDRG